MARYFDQSVRHQLRFLDLGCGQGASTWFLAREGFRVASVDGSISALIKANARLAKEALPFDGVACCFTKLPFANSSFDAIVDVVSSVHNPRDDLKDIWCREVARVLKPGGKVFSVMPTKTCARQTFKLTGPITFVSRNDVRWLLQDQYDNVDTLYSGYERERNCLIENWIVTADRSSGVA